MRVQEPRLKDTHKDLGGSRIAGQPESPHVIELVVQAIPPSLRGGSASAIPASVWELFLGHTNLKYTSLTCIR